VWRERVEAAHFHIRFALWIGVVLGLISLVSGHDVFEGLLVGVGAGLVISWVAPPEPARRR